MPTDIALFDYLQQRLSSLELEHESYKTHYRELSERFLPRTGRFLVTDRNRGGKVHNFIIDSSGTRALNIQTAGLMAGNSSPARNWFRLATPDRDLMKFQPVKIWLDDVADVMRNIFAASNFYRAIHTIYREMSLYGTAASLMLPNFEKVIRMFPATAGEYFIAKNFLGDIDTLWKKFDITVSMAVEQFGLKKVSQQVQDMYRKGDYDKWVTIVHALEPRRKRDRESRLASNKPFASIWWERSESHKEPMRISGFDRFPALVPRWDVSGGDIYGWGPGMEALGHVKQLQQDQLTMEKAKDYQSDPPVQVPISMKGREDLLPGGTNYVAETGPNQGIRTAFDVNLDLTHVQAGVLDRRDMIRAAFNVDLFQMISSDDRRQQTAREVVEKHEEKLLVLGPVLERVQNELLDPAIDNTFMVGLEGGIFPDPPQEMSGKEITVEYISLLAQAQKAIGIGAVERIIGTIQNIGATHRDALHKLDPLVAVDELADMMGVPSEIIVSNEKVALILKKEREAVQAAQALEQENLNAETMKKLSETDTSGENALTDISNQLSPVAAA